jgi:large subunit ribosomal protein L15
MRDIIKRLPKLRGHGVNRAATVNEERVRAVPINVGTLEALFVKGEVVSPQTLIAKGAVSAVRKQAPLVKILGTGDLFKALTVKGCQISAAAKAKIEAAGGSVE